MPYVPLFRSIHEVERPVAHRVHHNNSRYPAGRLIHEHLNGDGGYRLCDDCKEINRLER
jgi:hypothetical protein